MSDIDVEKGRSIRFPQKIWDALDVDAKRCKRSSVKQLEALLTAYYDLGNIELENNKIEFVQVQLNEKAIPRKVAAEKFTMTTPKNNKDKENAA